MPKAVREKMKIPERLKVGGHWYTVKYPHDFQERNDVWGAHLPHKRTILLAGDDGSGEKRAMSAVTVSFIHELLHAIDLIYGAECLFKFKANDGLNEESRVSLLAEAIFQVLVDNGWLETE